MLKGYWIANSEIADMEGLALYRKANRDVMNRYGAKFIVVHGQHEVVEGAMRIDADSGRVPESPSCGRMLQGSRIR